MNRKNLTAAVLAGLAGVVGIAGTAQAVNINPGGTGQVLLYPYYTTNGDNFTLLSVVNTSEDAKAVKVRFLESENSQEVLDFNLYMSAYDVWTAAVIPAGDYVSYDCDPSGNDVITCDGPVLAVADDETTCTVPNLGGMQSFLPFKYANDGGSQDHARMNEGHIEMIEMGTMIEDEWAAIAATHTTTANGWEPADCDALVEAWTEGINKPNGRWLAPDGSPDDGISAPSGGLFGGGAIVNIKAGAMHTYNANALNGWSDSGIDSTGANNHARPGDALPALASGDRTDGSVFSDSGQAIASDLPNSLDAVSYVLMQDAIMNEYVTGGIANGQTEWVVTFPTKREYVDSTVVGAPVRPFTTAWAVASGDTLATACETVELKTMWDREERTETFDCDDLGTCPDERPPVVSPRPPGEIIDPEGRVPFELCYETNVIRFGLASDCADDVCTDARPDTSEILGTSKDKYLNFDNEILGFGSGWARIELDDYVVWNPVTFGYDEESRDPVGRLEGLPVIGFAVQRFSNQLSGADGMTQSLYGGLFTHRSSRKLSSSD